MSELTCAISGTSGSSGLGSVNIEQIDNNTIKRPCADQRQPDSSVRPLKSKPGLTLADGQSWTPLIPQNVETDRPVRVDIGVVDSGGEADFGRLEGVVGREGEVEEKDTAGVRRIALYSARSGAYLRWRVVMAALVDV